MKNSIFKTLLLNVTILYSITNFSQAPFSRVIYDANPSYPSTEWRDVQHFSIEKSPSNSFYVMTSTGTNKQTLENNIELIRLDATGTPVWQKEINLSRDDRVLDVVIDANDDIILTGYTNLNSSNELYIAKYDANGNFITDFVLQKKNTVGTKIILDNRGEYLIGGYEFDKEQPFNMNGEAFLISVNQGLSAVKWKSNFTLSNTGLRSKNSAVNDILELPNGNIFVTGSIGSKDYQCVLACIVDPKNGQIIPNGDLSFQTESNIAMGASATYDIVDNQIFVLVNSKYGNLPRTHIVMIEGASSSIPGYVPSIDYTNFLEMQSGAKDAYAGYKIMMSQAYSDGLTIFGIKDKSTYPATEMGQWAIDINKYSAKPNTNVHLWIPLNWTSLPVSSYSSDGGPVLSWFSRAGHGIPYLFTSDIATFSLFGNRITSLTTGYPINKDVEIHSSTTDLAAAIVWPGCLDFTSAIGNPFDHTQERTKQTNEWIPNGNPNYVGSTYNFWHFPWCSVTNIAPQTTDDLKSLKAELLKEVKMTAYPNPFNTSITVGNDQNVKIKSIKVINSLGQVIVDENYTYFENKKHLDLNKLTNGMYYVKITSINNKTYTKRIIKQ